MNVKRLLAIKGMDVITTTADKSLKDVVILLAKHNIGALVVVDENTNPIGIISERDIVRQAAKQDSGPVLPMIVKDVMTKSVITGMPQDDIASAATMMAQKRFRHMPIVDEGKLVGIITLGDIVKAQKDEFEGKVETLQTQIMDA